MTSSARLQTCLLAFSAVLAGCGDFGHVNQGQVVEFDRSTGRVVLIGDSNYRDPGHPRFDVLPPVTVRTPRDPAEMGPEPEAGKLLQLDTDGHRAVIFDSSTSSLRSVAISVVSQQNDVRPGDSRIGHSQFPLVDLTAGTVTIYSPRHRTLVVFSPPAECLAWPHDTWKAGDEVRYYYKDPGQALRFMNVSKTDLNKAGK